ncbi:MAG: hypothetical protein GXX96_34535 [Planctomycetaceae bacterium]|nr:hypothetical protein [Planctomycetaceae bacterium]
MADDPTNPYRSPADHEAPSGPHFTGTNLKWFTLVGGVVGVLLPIGYGEWTIYSVRSQPLQPGEVACGMPILASMFLMVVGPLVGGVVLAVTGALTGAICDIVVFVWRYRAYRSSGRSRVHPESAPDDLV